MPPLGERGADTGLGLGNVELQATSTLDVSDLFGGLYGDLVA